jgi:glycosyltransferase involved in cell wall biosynthesis
VRICLVSREYPPETGGGGIGTQTAVKARGLSERGHDVHVVALSAHGLFRAYREGKVVIHRIPEPDPGFHAHEQHSSWLAYSHAVARKVHELDREVHFDIVHFPEYGGEGFVYQTDGFCHRRPRYSLQLHGPLSMFVEHNGWPARGSAFARIGCFMEDMVLHHADLVMASSRNTAEFCARRYGYPLDRIHVVRSGVDADRFAPRSAVSDPASPRLLFTGNLTANKGIGLVVRAVLQLRAVYPRIRLRAIGKPEDPALLSELMGEIEQADAEASFQFLGYVEHGALPEHHAWSDVLVGPSVFEPGPGNVYLEAMASGRPVIACQTGGAPEVVLHEQTGLLIPPNDVGALGQAIRRLADDVALRERLGRQGREWVLQEFTIPKYVAAVEGLFRALLDADG